MENSVLQAIDQRRSIRAYTGEQLTREELEKLISAALCAPTARNTQSRHFTVVQKKSLIDKINQAAVEQLKVTVTDPATLARISAPGYTVFYNAPTVIFISADGDSRYAIVDCGIAVQTIALAAQSMGLGSVILGMPRPAFEGPQKEALEQELAFPQGASFQIAIALGHPAAGKEKAAIEPGRVTVIS